MERKAFQLGLRIEQPQEQVNRWKYGRSQYLELLGAADYTLVAKGQRDLYTFCMTVRGRNRHSQHFRAEHVLLERHEQLATRHAVRQQRADDHARTGRVRLHAPAGGR
ncbi:MAG: hypothetical protein R3B90_11900 [Planctomycetaceae bacterium]